ncbi:MAG: hypothetical protein ILP09_01410, partial [Oscillospiraceae bacterium]|nr:hypothetical protein [Oscillospiraceae bacterium]
SALDALSSRAWDIVTLQQASGFSGVADSFEPYLTQMIQTVRSRCVELAAASGGEEHSFSPLAEELAEAILAGDLRALAGASVKAEKLDRADFDALTDELYVLFAVKARQPRLREAAAEAAGWMDRLRDMRRSNVSAGHCMGYLLSLVK